MNPKCQTRPRFDTYAARSVDSTGLFSMLITRAVSIDRMAFGARASRIAGYRISLSAGSGSLEPRRQAQVAVAPPHPRDAGARCVFVAPATVAVDHLRQLITEFVGQPVLVSKVVQGAVARRQGHVEGSEADKVA